MKQKRVCTVPAWCTSVSSLLAGSVSRYTARRKTETCAFGVIEKKSRDESAWRDWLLMRPAPPVCASMRQQRRRDGRATATQLMKGVLAAVTTAQTEQKEFITLHDLQIASAKSPKAHHHHHQQQQHARSAKTSKYRSK